MNDKIDDDRRNMIVIWSDVHAGRNPPENRDERGVSPIGYAHLAQFEEFVDDIIARGDVLLVLDCGDVFDNKIVNPTLRDRTFDIYEKLRRNNIGVIIVGGNHDNHHADSDQGCDLNVLDRAQNVIAVRDFMAFNPVLSTKRMTWATQIQPQKITGWFANKIIPKLRDARLGFTFAPYKLYGEIVEQYWRQRDATVKSMDAPTYRSWRRKITPDQIRQYVATILMPELLASLKECDHKLLLGHYNLQNAKNHQYEFALEKSSIEMRSDEMPFTSEMIDTQYDLAVFGHIHLPQEAFGRSNVMHVGSLDRVKFDEREDPKRYLMYNIDTHTWESISTAFDPDHPDNVHARIMDLITITIPDATTDPNEYVINEIMKYGDLKAIDVHIRITISIGDYQRINLPALRDMLGKNTFHYTLEITREQVYDTQDVARTQSKTPSLELSSLFDQFIPKHTAHPQYLLLKDVGKKIMEIAIAKELEESILKEKE